MQEKEGKEQEKKQKAIRGEDPIKARHLIVAGAMIIFILASMIMIRISEKNFPANIPARPLDQFESDRITAEENELITEEIKNETGAWLERLTVPQREFVSDLKGIDISELGPDEAYLVMRKEFEKVENMGDFMAFIEIYGSDKNIMSLQQLKVATSLMGDDVVIEAIKAHFAEDIKSVEIITSSKEKAVMKVFSKTGREGEATMVFERGSWRIDSEEW